MSDFAWFPKMIGGIILFLAAIQIIPVLLGPFALAIGIALLAVPAIMLISMIKRRSPSQHDRSDHK